MATIKGKGSNTPEDTGTHNRHWGGKQLSSSRERAVTRRVALRAHAIAWALSSLKLWRPTSTSTERRPSSKSGRRSQRGPFQVQPATHRRLSEPFRLPARSLPGTWCRRHRRYAAHQGALLPESSHDKSNRHYRCGAHDESRPSTWARLICSQQRSKKGQVSAT
jgi:hypothetical protein